jgi:L-alanine-DL-glutamate epimerase-like enolase superfamily enzyme
MEFPVRAVTHDSWYDPAFVIQPGGRVKVPTGPGLGISYDEGIWKQAEKL